MYRSGHLFAWHLHAEAVPIFEQQPLLRLLGEPEPYRNGLQDVASFQRLLRRVPEQMALNSGNALYETGLVYVCLRNIAMAASWTLCRKPDFSRQSPFTLRGVGACPIAPREYRIAMACRLSGQRGLPPPAGVDAEFATKMSHRASAWAEEIRLKLARERQSGNQIPQTRFESRVSVEREFLGPVNAVFGGCAPLTGITRAAIESWCSRAQAARPQAGIMEVARILLEASARAELLADSSKEVFEPRRRPRLGSLAGLRRLLEASLARRTNSSNV
jgi:hypothetical protein